MSNINFQTMFQAAVRRQELKRQETYQGHQRHCVPLAFLAALPLVIVVAVNLLMSLIVLRSFRGALEIYTR